VFPYLEDPDENIKVPEDPVFPEFADRIVMIPLVEAVPSPELMVIAPPVFERDRPAWISRRPPAPDPPDPTVKLSRPARPVTCFDSPEPIFIAPVFPEDAVPELKTSMPLNPRIPAFAVRTKIDPLDVAVPSPALSVMTPPVQ
jgi:hypothetical protein